MEALIVSVADKYDALRSARQYKPEYSHDKAIALLRKDDRTGATGEELFGPEVFNTLLRQSRRFEEIYEELRDTPPEA